MTHTELIDFWPSISVFAEDLGIAYGTAKAMRRRGSVPSEHWIAMVDAARARALVEVSLDSLAAAVARTKVAE